MMYLSFLSEQQRDVIDDIVANETFSWRQRFYSTLISALDGGNHTPDDLELQNAINRAVAAGDQDWSQWDDCA